MKLVKWTVIRRFYSYKKVTRPDGYKVVERKLDHKLSTAKLIDAKIQAGGPISVADYMKTVLTNPSSGYYLKRDAIGRKGDFITSPEITQIFGEIVGVWIYNELLKIGTPPSWQLIELGPGRGTLLFDILRVLRQFKATDGLSVHLVEVSPHLSSLQSQIICEDVICIGGVAKPTSGPHFKSGKTSDNVEVYWYNKIEDVPRGFSVVLAHEFFDALPVHKFQKVPEGWREVLVNSKKDENNGLKFEYVLSQTETPISKLLIRKEETREHVEISPETGTIVKYISELLSEEGGFSLFIDYGHSGEKTDTFRAFKDHQLHDPLADPGLADVTADVNFSFVKEIMESKLLTFGPVDQGDFLRRMEIKARLDNLLKYVKDEKQGEILQSGYNMIVDKSQMGSRYKFFAAFPAVLKERLEKYPVLGFHDISG